MNKANVENTVFSPVAMIHHNCNLNVVHCQLQSLLRHKLDSLEDQLKSPFTNNLLLDPDYEYIRNSNSTTASIYVRSDTSETKRLFTVILGDLNAHYAN